MPKAQPLTAIVLAAGAARRMGAAKGLLPLVGKPLIRHHVERLAAHFAPVVVVVGREADRHREAVAGVAEAVENADWARTAMIDSLRCALDALGLAGPCVVTPVDVPPPRLETLEVLLAAGAPAVPVGPDGRDGHPVPIDAAMVATIRAGAVEGGLRELLRNAPRVAVGDPRVGLDFDDPEAWEEFVVAWGRVELPTPRV